MSTSMSVIPTSWKDVFDSSKKFFRDFYASRDKARECGYEWFAFNSMVYPVTASDVTDYISTRTEVVPTAVCITRTDGGLDFDCGNGRIITITKVAKDALVTYLAPPCEHKQPSGAELTRFVGVHRYLDHRAFSEKLLKEFNLTPQPELRWVREMPTAKSTPGQYLCRNLGSSMPRIVTVNQYGLSSHYSGDYLWAGPILEPLPAAEPEVVKISRPNEVSWQCPKCDRADSTFIPGIPCDHKCVYCGYVIHLEFSS